MAAKSSRRRAVVKEDALPVPFVVPGGVKKKEVDELGKLSRRALLHEVRKWRDLAQARGQKVASLFNTYEGLAERLKRLEFMDRDGAKEWVTYSAATDLEHALKEQARVLIENKNLRQSLAKAERRVEMLEEQLELERSFKEKA